MRIFRHYNDLPAEVLGGAVAIGNFDGVHRGHQVVIGEAGMIARSANIPWAVLTFEPHPRSVFRPDDPPFRLTPFRTKSRHIEALGVDVLVVQHFDREFSQRPAEDFINHVLSDGLGARHVIAGYDFVFGRDRGGDCDMLLHMGKEKGFDFTAVSKVTDARGDVFSSTRVRNALMNANPREASFVLGRPFEVDGRVEHGDARGRTIGFATANIHLDEYIRPATGVYAVRAGIDRGEDTQWMDGVANLGKRPTFAGEDIVLEAHLFDFDGDLYGRHLRIQLIDFLREERKFDTLDALRTQIRCDCEKAKRILSRRPGI